MTSSYRRAIVALSLATSLAGCTLTDSRSFELTGMSAGPVDQQLLVQVIARGIDEAWLDVDGAPAGRFPANTTVAIDTSRLVQGEHLLTARAVTGRPIDDATLRFQVVAPPPAVVRVEPPYGPVAGDAPLAIVVEFSERVMFDDTTEPLSLAWIGGAQAVVVRSVASDGRSVRFEVAVPGTSDGFSLHGVVHNSRGVALRFQAPWPPTWTVNVFNAGISEIAYELPVRGLVKLQPVFEGGVMPSSTEVLVNDQVIATMGAGAWGTIDWDTSGFPEGRYVVSLRAPGFTLRFHWLWPSYVVDRKPPTATCAGWGYRAPEAATQLGIEECVSLRFSELIVPLGSSIQLLDDGVPIATQPPYFKSDSPYPSNSANAVVVCPVAPRRPGAKEQVVIHDLADIAGNPLTPDTWSLSVPPTLAPWGAGPLTDRGSEPHVSGLSVTGWQSGDRIGPSLWSSSVAMISAPGTDVPGSVKVMELWGPEPYRSFGLFTTPGIIYSHPAISDGWLLAAKAGGSGSRDLIPFEWIPSTWWTAATTPLDAVAANDADEPVVRANPGVAVWSEGPPGGIRTLQGAEVLMSPDVWNPLAGDPRGSLTGSASHPALAVHHPASAPNVALVAFLETAPGGAPRLRAASVDLGGGSWVPVMGDLDLGLGAPSDPAIAMSGELPALAWIEDGQVRLRMGTLGAAGLAFGPAVALNHDAALPARAARLIATLGARATLLFVEAGPTGDQLWARHWDGTSWVLQPGPINAGTGDAIVELAADGVPDAQGVVAWTDALGRVYLRVLNW